MKRASLILIPLIPLLLILGRQTSADTVVLTSGSKVHCGVHRDEPDGIAINPYFSRHPGMVFEVKSIPRSQVKEVILEEPAFQEFVRRRMGCAADLPGLLELAAWCKEKKLKAERELTLLDALRLDPANEGALKAYGRSKFGKVVRGDPDFDPEARAAIDAYLAIRDPEERKPAFGRLKREHSITLPREYLDRIIRSGDQPKGLMEGRALTLGSKEHPGTYALFVPKEYDPRHPWPLILGLHGGGAGGARRDAVVGSGESAMNFYVRQAARRGYIVVCPTARAAPWASTGNREYIPAVLDEIQLLYHIDLNRVYLTGHSMGGFGSWYFGGMLAERFAAVSPMAGGGRGIGRFVDTNTPLFVFHGADDGVVPPGNDRAAARQLAKTKLDFIYTELAGIGHGFPASIQKDLFDFFDVRRLCRMRGKRPLPPSAAVRSSFLGKVSREEKRFLGDPTEYGSAGKTRGELKALLKDIQLGGGKAAAAANRLMELKDPDSVKPLSGLLRNPKFADDVKVQAARTLGGIGDAEAYKGLSAGLHSENHAVFIESAKAMAAIGAEKAGEALKSSFAHLDKILESKRLGGNRMHISDWERWLPAYGAVVKGLGDLKPEGAAAAIKKSPVKRVIDGNWDVLYSRRINQDPARALGALQAQIEAALAKIERE